MDNYEGINGGHCKKWISQTFPLEACCRVVLVASGTSKSKCKGDAAKHLFLVSSCSYIHIYPPTWHSC
ncbi:hypothetical protein QJS10_CPB12g01649 [Acorus calamus]|uniref:Uncharacterized protein n=1 Tax=Acorus calamus TaxID=4465 RepID=A0AAV9DKL3_ACOCL|nr:hypothetical protein QJS10_CPB12g01649 [Acorus calamus]